MTARPLGITGSTGRLGGRVARLLAESAVPQRLLVRDAARAPDLTGTTSAVMTYADGHSVATACEGLDVVWMVSASEDEHRLAEHRSFIDAAAAAGVRPVGYTTVDGAAPDATFTLARDHFHTEEHLKASGMAWTMVRDNLYLDFLPYFAGDEGVLRGPAGDGRVAAVAFDDIAAVLHAVLRHPGAHAGATYSLTGPEGLTLAEAAAIMTRATGREFRYVDETLEEAYASRASYGAPDWQVDAWVSTYTSIARGEMADDVRRLSGRPPLSLAELLAR